VDGKVPAPRGPPARGPRECLLQRAGPYLTRLAAPSSRAAAPSSSLLQVDAAVQGASQAYASNSAFLAAQLDRQRAFHAANLESYKAAREAYLKRVEESVDYVRAHGLTGAARRAADEAAAAAAEARKLPSAVLARVHAAYERMAALEPVQRALGAARPAVDAAYARAEALGAAVVRSPSYKRAVDAALGAAAAAQETAAFRAAQGRLYPYVAKYADPAIAAVTESAYYKQAVAALTPAVPAA
jgi:hypothetical protein